MRIAISTGGGDAPGLNAVIRAAVLAAITRGWEVLGVKRGFAGLLGEDEVVILTRESVRGIAHLGGTILRTTNRGNPFSYPRALAVGRIEELDRSDELMENAKQLGIDAMIAIGGDGSLRIAQALCDKGMKIVGVPKTIDNDVSGTITTFGFDTAVNTAATYRSSENPCPAKLGGWAACANPSHARYSALRGRKHGRSFWATCSAEECRPAMIASSRLASAAPRSVPWRTGSGPTW